VLPRYSKIPRANSSRRYARRRPARELCLIHTAWILAPLLLLPFAAPVGAAGAMQASVITPRAVGCDGGLVHDDGTWESGLFVPTMVQRFAPAAEGSTLDSVCICWNHPPTGPDQIDYDLVVLAADGPGGEPGTELDRFPVSASGVSTTRTFFHHDLSALDVEAPAAPFYLGVDTNWSSSEAFLCSDLNGPSTQPVYTRGTGDWKEESSVTALGIRAELAGDGPPSPPGSPVLDNNYPDFRFWVRITAQQPILGTHEPNCIDETVCFSGAIAGRSEVFVRIVGPKPNGMLWPTMVKFTTSQVEVWIEQISTGQRQYYLLDGASPGFDELPGLFDREGFSP